MVYAIAELRNYRQLLRLRAESLPAVEAGLAAVLGARAEPVAAAGQGVWMVELGTEEDFNAGAAAAAACRIRDFLASHREELFGFAVLIAPFSAVSGAARADGIRQLLEEAEAEEHLWLAPACVQLFIDYLDAVPAGVLHRVIRQRLRPGAAPLPQGSSRPWVRETLLGRALEIVASRLNTGDSREILLVHGPPGVGKTAVLDELAERLLHGAIKSAEYGGATKSAEYGGAIKSAEYGGAIKSAEYGGAGVPVLRLRTIFKRRSPLHPFLSSLHPSLLDAVPGFLRGPERAAWDDVGSLLGWLESPERPGSSPEMRPLPDHILEDFSLGYLLYLLAWTRMAEESALPALLVCEEIESYHPAARRIVARLLDDLLTRPPFLPLLSSADARAPEELSGLDLRPLAVQPLGKREISSLARHLFPGLEIPGALARHLRKRSGGRYVSVISYLRFLSKTGAIRESGDRYVWNPPLDEAILLPANPLSVSWYLIRALGDDALLMYALYLAGGLLDRQGFLSFVKEAGFDASAVGRFLAGLPAAGLMADGEALVPRFPALRRKLEELLGAEGASLRDRFVTHVVSLWKSGRYRHPVLLFTFLARSGRTDLALRILPHIIRRKLDENDVAGARAFCDPRTLEFSVPPIPEQTRELAMVTAIGRLRAALLAEDPEAAGGAQAEARRSVSADAPAGLRGEVYIERAKFHLFSGDAAAALEELKKGLLLYQEPGVNSAAPSAGERGESACYLWLGATMLADGRLREAVEYLGLSHRLCHEAGDAPGVLWSLVYLANCLFIDGRYTQCLAAIEQGLRSAGASYRREVELFLLFLRARTLFQVGSYEDCSRCLQACLCTATLYSVEAALPVLRGWLGRTLVHQGDVVSGTRLLESLAQTREVLFFQAEAALFSGGLENASFLVERGLTRPEDFRFSSPEAIPWSDGFAGIESRCFRLSRGGVLLRRTLSGLRAYLQGLRGFGDAAIRELHQLTRGEKAVEEDPAVAWFYYLYSSVLPETGSEEVDDKVTVLSRSLKILQERASRIDDPAERGSFLSRNRWNRMIMEEGRERKLV